MPTPVSQQTIKAHVCNTCRPNYGLPQITFTEQKLKTCVICGDIEFGDDTPCVLNDWLVLVPAIIVDPTEEETHDANTS
jgi:hypothetical protein